MNRIEVVDSPEPRLAKLAGALLLSWPTRCSTSERRIAPLSGYRLAKETETQRRGTKSNSNTLNRKVPSGLILRIAFGCPGES
jgi:hypothetical protein